MSEVRVRLLERGDADALERVAPGVFDGAVDARRVAEFLADGRHHMAVAIWDGVVIGMASAFHYVHPDKPPELWINEIATAPSHRRAGVGRRLLEALLGRARELGCASAWTLTGPDNTPARALFQRLGGRKAEPGPEMFEFELG